MDRKRYRTVEICLAFSFAGRLFRKTAASANASSRELCTIHYIFDDYSIYPGLSAGSLIQLSQWDKFVPQSVNSSILQESLYEKQYYYCRYTKRKLGTIKEIFDYYKEEGIDYFRQHPMEDPILDVMYDTFDSMEELLDTNRKGRVKFPSGSSSIYPKFNKLFEIDKDFYVGVHLGAEERLCTLVPLDFVYSEMNKTRLI